jgi:hypothetical protein
MEQEKKKLNGMVKEFLTYDNQIAQTEKILKKYRDNLKVAKENREKLKKTIYNQMKILDTEELALGEIEGRIEFFISKKRDPLNKEWIQERCLKFFNGDKTKADNLYEFIYNPENRNINEKRTIKRLRPRKKKD